MSASLLACKIDVSLLRDIVLSDPMFHMFCVLWLTTGPTLTSHHVPSSAAAAADDEDGCDGKIPNYDRCYLTSYDY